MKSIQFQLIESNQNRTEIPIIVLSLPIWFNFDRYKGLGPNIPRPITTWSLEVH